ncbi:MAG: hypothetical protein M1417_01345 [Candidatus Thermoplasmatota archaeon]|nr:hypothetical protein [Candidatus Thermoplasmatota archaeon]
MSSTTIISPPPITSVAKLNETQIRFIYDHIVHRKDWSVSRIAIQYGVTTRRVRQLVAQYRRTGKRSQWTWHHVTKFFL